MVAVGVLASVVAGCGGNVRTLPGCPPISTNAQKATVDYVDFIEANDTQYVAPLGNPLTVPFTALGAEQLSVRCSFSALNALTRRETPRPQNGDAAFLAPGTPIYAITGWPVLCRLAAQSGDDGQWHVYLAQENDAQRATTRPCALNN
jgi:hypothetical protein